jgi:15-cis-phytoene synthase
VTARDLTAAGLRDERLVAAYSGCAAYLARRNSAAYPAARRLLPPWKRPYWDAMLAFSTYVDDVIDDPLTPPGERVERYRAYERYFFRLMDEDDAAAARMLLAEGGGHPADGEPPSATGRHLAYAFRHFARTWGIPPSSVREFMETIRTDLHITEYPAFADLERYVAGVCGQGSMWGNTLLEPISPAAAPKSVALSFGLQITDYLRDLREDLADGRLYLPLEDLARFGLSRAEVESAAAEGRMTEPLRELVRFEVDRARRFFDECDDWWRLVHPSSCELPRQYVRLGRNTLEQIARSDHDIFRARPRRHLLNTGWALAGMTWGYLRTATGRLAAPRHPVGA